MMLRAFRERSGLSRAALASLAGISHQYIAALEVGSRREPALRILNALADAMSLSGDERAQLVLSFALPPSAVVVEGGVGGPTGAPVGMLQGGAQAPGEAA